MLEYGVKQVITNPTIITRATDIIRLVDSRNNQTRAFVLPAMYEDLIEKLSRDIEYKKWVEEKKLKLKNYKKDNLDDIAEAGMDSIQEYLK